MISLAICLIGGGVLAYYFARKNYNPVNELVELLSEKAKISFETTKHEYEFIKGIVYHTFDEKEEINRRLEQTKFGHESQFCGKVA
ncbi:hypothetical protein RAC89_14135 [Paenibacillus sp. GD4]|uniref:hypothetical protein n=1 Tax=Paenibacillus sp. GD4 TaxID=3068890 RepID=UPI0027964EF3|nr:hypothetical protein [Paenibacillus sp. GD4]MDQ1911565.1 hypothetical protein [Paenibacillus sp. GD4]